MKTKKMVEMHAILSTIVMLEDLRKTIVETGREQIVCTEFIGALSAPIWKLNPKNPAEDLIIEAAIIAMMKKIDDLIETYEGFLKGVMK